MNINKDNLPDDPAALHQIIIAISDQSNKYKEQLQKEQSRYQELEDKFKILQKLYSGCRFDIE